jgi:cobalt/nickel transport system permease protein
MSKFNSSVLLISAFLYSIFVSFNKVEIFFLLPLLFVSYCEYKNLFFVLKKVVLLNLFILMIFIVLLFQTSFEDALNIYIRTNLIMIFNLLLLSNSDGYDIVRALNELRFPKRVVSSFYFSLKMIQTLNDEFKKIKQTLKTRGFKANSSMFTYEVYGNLFGHIFVKSLKKASALQDSFQLRGFHGRIYLINRTKFSFYDVVLIFLVCMLFVKKVIV